MSETLPGWRAGLALLLSGLPYAAAAEPAVKIVGTELRMPPDSHEPQKARVSLHNAGAAATGFTLACTFQADDGAALDKVEATVREIAAGATTVAEVIYYGWPRASRATCRLGERR